MADVFFLVYFFVVEVESLFFSLRLLVAVGCSSSEKISVCLFILDYCSQAKGHQSAHLNI